MHALIIEDEAMIAALIEAYLRDMGYTSVAFATTEEEAMASAERRCPDLITSDVRLTPGCGIAAVQAICSGRPIPVVFVTASGWEVRERVDAALVVAKPFTAADLARAIDAARARSRGG
jgi:two-component system, response regulator PdtaR